MEAEERLKSISKSSKKPNQKQKQKQTIVLNRQDGCEGSELDTMASRELAKKQAEIDQLREREDDNLNSITRENDIMPVVHIEDKESCDDSNASSLTMANSFSEFKDDESIPDQNPHEFVITSKKLKKILDKDMTLEEKEIESKKAMDHDIRQYIARKQREVEMALKVEKDKSAKSNHINHKNLYSDSDNKSHNSNSTEHTGHLE